MSAGHRGIDLLVWVVVFTSLCIIFLGLRFWAARLIKRTLYLDDYLIVFAFMNTFALSGVTIWAIFNGLGKNTLDLNDWELGVQYKLIVAALPTWLFSTVAIKLSILWFYTRLFSIRSFRRWAWVLKGVCVAYLVAFFCVFFTRCRPISQGWDPQPDGSCRDIIIDELASVVFNMIIDVAIIVLPLPVLWGLQLPIRSKIAVTVMLSIGLITIGIIAWRLHFTIVSKHDPDFVYRLFLLSLISLMELWLGIIVACVPSLAPIFKTYVKPAVARIGTRSATGSAHTDARSQYRLRDVRGGTFGSGTFGSGTSERDTKPYRQLSDDSSLGSEGGAEEERKGPDTGAVGVRTECSFDPRAQAGREAAGEPTVPRRTLTVDVVTNRRSEVFPDEEDGRGAQASWV